VVGGADKAFATAEAFSCRRRLPMSDAAGARELEPRASNKMVNER
jgi:hypothetical protein